MKIGIAQLDPTVGDFEGNVRKISEAYLAANAGQARILITSELSICGYPPHDLMERPEWSVRCEKALEQLKKITHGKSCALLVGTTRNKENVAVVLEGGKEVFAQSKTLLPTYDVFDESRYFKPASEIKLWNCDGKKTAIAICEDLWGSATRNLEMEYQKQGAELLISLSASPYEWGKQKKRIEIHSKIAKFLKIPLVYVNQVGATDELLFDGASFVIDSKGVQVWQAEAFGTRNEILDIDKLKTPFQEDKSEIANLCDGLVLGIKDYFTKCGFKEGLIGLSGGIDSAVVACLAVRALGAKNVRGVLMPSQHSSIHSLEDAESLARNLKMPFEVKPIKFSYATLAREFKEGRGEIAPLALENLQARLRAITLLTLANHHQALVFSTGNKSEIAMGYCTQYGDMVGALAPIGDLFKTRVYELAKHINQTANEIPERSITKAPSAELRPNQKDSDTLPPYENLDLILKDFIEGGVAIEKLKEKYGFSWITDVLKTVDRNEYKRRQSAIVFKTSSKSFGLGWRMPIAKQSVLE